MDKHTFKVLSKCIKEECNSGNTMTEEFVEDYARHAIYIFDAIKEDLIKNSPEATTEISILTEAVDLMEMKLHD